MIKLGKMVTILDLHQQGLSVSAIAKATGANRKTVRKYIERGLEVPSYAEVGGRLAKAAPIEVVAPNQCNLDTPYCQHSRRSLL